MKTVSILRAWALLALLSIVATGLNLPPFNASQYTNSTAAGLPMKASQRWTYYLHSTCKDKEEFMEAFDEARSMACSANKRIRFAGDSDFQRVFYYTFHDSMNSDQKYSKSESWSKRYQTRKKYTPYEIAYWVVRGICTFWDETQDRDSATLRFYCDSGLSFNTRIDGDGGIDRDTGERFYMDPDNGVRGYRACDEYLGESQHSRRIAAYLSRTTLLNYPSQAKYRGVVTCCDAMFEGLAKHMATTIDDLSILDLQNAHIDEFLYLPSVAILHTWMQSQPYLLDNIVKYTWLGQPIAGSAYGWANNMEKTAQESLKNANTHAMFALWAKLADTQRADIETGGSVVMRGGFTLPRKPGDEFPEAQAEAEKQAREGKIACYADMVN